ncbi:MAG: glycosyltransferase family 9 protein [Candidatus Eremiobacteraeota bacterium]|nr:glycosyltransferase family 9 protein [Candidatus Eremiobacteraeota bacterium]MBC5827177.1 glycosyltransferase family 9 protein [Candidatus Eremiobacteraeota bacterium]
MISSSGLQNGVVSYRRILLIRTDRVGDLVLSTPAIASFRRSWPQARIEALVTPYTEPILRYSPDVDAVHVLAPGMRRQQARAFVRRLATDADLVVALAPRTADYRLAAWTRAPRRIGYVYQRRYGSRLAARFLLSEHGLSSADPQLAERFPQHAVPHEVEQVLALVPLAGGHVRREELVLQVGDEEAALAGARIPPGAIGLNLSPRWFASNFGFDAVKSLIERLAADRRDVVVIHGNDVAETAARLGGAVCAPGSVWLGAMPLLEWAAALGRCGVVLTVDSGATHVAAAMGAPVVVVFEDKYFRLSSQEWAPWRVPHVMLRKPRTAAGAQALIEHICAAAVSLCAAGTAAATGAG